MTDKQLSPVQAKFPPLRFQFLKGVRCSANINGRWYAATDVARKMRTNTGSLTRRFDSDDVITRYRPTEKGYRDLAFISERALFSIIFKGSGEWAEKAKEEIMAAANSEQGLHETTQAILDGREAVLQRIAELEARREETDIQLAKLKRQL